MILPVYTTADAVILENIQLVRSIILLMALLVLGYHEVTGEYLSDSESVFCSFR